MYSVFSGEIFHATCLGEVFRSLSFFTFFRGAACVGREEKYVEIDTRLCLTFPESRGIFDSFCIVTFAPDVGLLAHIILSKRKDKKFVFDAEEPSQYVLCFLSRTVPCWIQRFQPRGFQQFYQLVQGETDTIWRNNFRLVWTSAS